MEYEQTAKDISHHSQGTYLIGVMNRNSGLIKLIIL